MTPNIFYTSPSHPPNAFSHKSSTRPLHYQGYHDPYVEGWDDEAEYEEEEGEREEEGDGIDEDSEGEEEVGVYEDEEGVYEDEERDVYEYEDKDEDVCDNRGEETEEDEDGGAWDEVQVHPHRKHSPLRTRSGKTRN